MRFKDHIKVTPLTKRSLTEFFDMAEVDVSPEVFMDYHRLRALLIGSGMRFIDANVFIYAVVKPKRRVPKDIVDIKSRAKAIMERVDGGEPVLTSVVHLSEVANVLEGYLRPGDLNE